MNRVAHTDFRGMQVARQPLIALLHDSARVLTPPMRRSHLAQVPQYWCSEEKYLSVYVQHRVKQAELIFERGQRQELGRPPVCTLRLIRINGPCPRRLRRDSEVTIDNAFVLDSRKSIAGLTHDERVIVRYVRFYMAQLGAMQATRPPVVRGVVHT